MSNILTNMLYMSINILGEIKSTYTMNAILLLNLKKNYLFIKEMILERIILYLICGLIYLKSRTYCLINQNVLYNENNTTIIRFVLFWISILFKKHVCTRWQFWTSLDLSWLRFRTFWDTPPSRQHSAMLRSRTSRFNRTTTRPWKKSRKAWADEFRENMQQDEPRVLRGLVRNEPGLN